VLLEKPIKIRAAFTFAAGVVRITASFIVAAVLTRALGAGDYGTLSFLLGSFTAIRTLIELSTPTAFYTFLSQRDRPYWFVLTYLAWQACQLILLMVALALLIPDDYITLIWLGQDRNLIVMACISSFCMQQAWETASQIAESKRLTLAIQKIGLSVTLAHLALIIVCWRLDVLSIQLVLIFILLEYGIACLIAHRITATEFINVDSGTEKYNLNKILREYIHFCKPLALYSVLSFAYAFADNWLLQKYGGAEERAYYAVAFQMSSGAMIVTTALMQIFWKEVAEANSNEDTLRLQVICLRSIRLVCAASAVIACGLLPWTLELTTLIYGSDFTGAVGTTSMMLIYPVYASIGMVVGTAFVATNKSKRQLQVGIPLMIVGLSASYFVQAPVDAWLPGLSLGSQGLALKTVTITFVASNVMLWIAARDFGWKFDWIHQFVVIAATLACGITTYWGVNILGVMISMSSLLKVGIGIGSYAICIIFMFRTYPALAGLTHADFQIFARRFS
jgi:O-antigen/teichoic acid export membrane protein